MKCLGVILSTNDHSVIDRALWAGLLTKTGELLESILRGFSRGKKILKEICWALSNLTASGSHHVEKFAESTCLQLVTEIVLDSSAPVDARKEGLWVLCNAITIAEGEVKLKMVQSTPTLLGCLVMGCRPGQDMRLLKNVLEAIYDVLELDNFIPEMRQTDNSIAYNWEKAGGIDALEEVQHHPTLEIYKAAGEIITRFFSLAEGSMAPAQQPQTSTQINGNQMMQFNI